MGEGEGRGRGCEEERKRKGTATKVDAIPNMTKVQRRRRRRKRMRRRTSRRRRWRRRGMMMRRGRRRRRKRQVDLISGDGPDFSAIAADQNLVASTYNAQVRPLDDDIVTQSGFQRLLRRTRYQMIHAHQGTTQYCHDLTL
eukprot:1347629-Pyramimonas_sp.AAC.1